MPLTKEDKLRALTAAFMVVGSLAVVGIAISLLFLNIHSNDDTDIIVDCTQPGGECYERGQANTAKAVQALIDAGNNNASSLKNTVLWTEYCSNTVLPPIYEIEELTECVERLVNAGP